MIQIEPDAIDSLSCTVAQNRPGALAFVVYLDAVQQDMRVVLGGDGVALVAWAWLHPDQPVSGTPL